MAVTLQGLVLEIRYGVQDAKAHIEFNFEMCFANHLPSMLREKVGNEQMHQHDSESM